MRDFLVGLFIIAFFTLACLGVGIAVCSFITLDPGDDNLFVKGMLGFFSIVGGFVFVMLCGSVGALISKSEE